MYVYTKIDEIDSFIPYFHCLVFVLMLGNMYCLLVQYYFGVVCLLLNVMYLQMWVCLLITFSPFIDLQVNGDNDRIKMIRISHTGLVMHCIIY